MALHEGEDQGENHGFETDSLDPSQLKMNFLYSEVPMSMQVDGNP
jgi:hypothetical protein